MQTVIGDFKKNNVECFDETYYNNGNRNKASEFRKMWMSINAVPNIVSVN